MWVTRINEYDFSAVKRANHHWTVWSDVKVLIPWWMSARLCVMSALFDRGGETHRSGQIYKTYNIQDIQLYVFKHLQWFKFRLNEFLWWMCGKSLLCNMCLSKSFSFTFYLVRNVVPASIFCFISGHIWSAQGIAAVWYNLLNWNSFLEINMLFYCKYD